MSDSDLLTSPRASEAPASTTATTDDSTNAGATSPRPADSPRSPSQDSSAAAASSTTSSALDTSPTSSSTATSVATSASSTTRTGDLFDKRQQKLELQAQIELIKSETKFLERDTSVVKERMQQLMQEYLIVKRDHSVLFAKFRGTDAERKMRGSQRKAHQEWVAQQSAETIERRIIKAQALARGYIQRRNFGKLVKQNKQRNQHINELLETERTYVYRIKQVVKIFKVPLRYACNTPVPIIREAEIERIFGNIEDIWNWHAQWVRVVADRWANWSNNALIGDLLIELKQVLPLYKRFGQYHAAGIKIVERLSKRNAAFVQFASKIHDLVHDLPSLLIEPIQRIPRYKLMLTDIIKHTNQEHPDYYNLKEAEQVIEHILAEMNLAAKFSNNRRKILDIEYMFNGDVNLLDWADNRRYVQSADIRAITQHLQKERRQLVDVRIWLFSDRIIIGQLKEEYFEGEPEYHLIASMDLFDVHVEVSHERQKDDKTAEPTYPFLLRTSHVNNVYTVICGREQERRMWLELINKHKTQSRDELLKMK